MSEFIRLTILSFVNQIKEFILKLFDFNSIILSSNNSITSENSTFSSRTLIERVATTGQSDTLNVVSGLIFNVNFSIVVSGNLEELSIYGVGFSGFPNVVRLVGTFIHNPRVGRNTLDGIITQESTSLEPVLL